MLNNLVELREQVGTYSKEEREDYVEQLRELGEYITEAWAKTSDALIELEKANIFYEQFQYDNGCMVKELGFMESDISSMKSIHDQFLATSKEISKTIDALDRDMFEDLELWEKVNLIRGNYSNHDILNHFISYLSDDELEDIISDFSDDYDVAHYYDRGEF